MATEQDETAPWCKQQGDIPEATAEGANPEAVTAQPLPKGKVPVQIRAEQFRPAGCPDYDHIYIVNDEGKTICTECTFGKWTP